MRSISLEDFYFLSFVALVKMIDWLPPPGAYKPLVRVFSFAAYQLSTAKRRLIEKHLSKTLGRSLTEEQRKNIANGAFHGFCQEMFFWSLSSPERVTDVELRGVERLREALGSGRGVIRWESNGFGRRLLAKQILKAHGFAVHQVHGSNNLGGFLTDSSSASWMRAWVRRFFDGRERRWVADIINLPKSGSLAFTRILLNRLNKNAILCVSGDGRDGRRLMPIQFLGSIVPFATGMVTLAKISGATILPIFCIRERNGKSILIIESPIVIQSEDDRERGLKNGVEQYATLLEAYVRRYPELYRNWHLLGDSPDRLSFSVHDCNESR